ncbi:major facilitator superfamily domain-containing protein 7-like protein, partial [Leptotrombidium deliense]
MDSTSNSATHVQWLVYKRRWLILAIVALLNALCGLLWISFSYSVAFQAAKYYQVSQSKISYFTSSMFAVNALCGLLAMWTLDKFGLKPGIRIGMLFVVLGCVFRAFSTQLSDNIANRNNKFYLTLVSQWVIAVGQPFLLFTPTKVAECWFPDYQRVSATTMVSMGTPFGFIIGGLLLPRVVLHPDDIPKLNCFIAVPAIIASLLSLLITTSTPPTPPSGSAAIKTNRPFFSVIKKIITEKAFLLLMLYVGSALGILFALTVNLGELISDKYNEVGCGMAASVLMSGGIIGAIIASFIADITRKFITIMKISACFTAVSLC